jgi:hypothetical protein
MDAVSAYEIATVLEKVAAQYDVIGIDEGQFVSSALLLFIFWQ